MMPVEHPNTRKKPLASANGHGRYTTIAHERPLSLLGNGRCTQQLCIICDRFASKTVTWRPFRFGDHGSFRSEAAA
jgi:hypothetical protein